MVWYGPTSQTAWMQRIQKKWLNKYRIYRSEEDKQYNLLKLFELLFSFFQVLQISLLFVLFHSKKIAVNCTSALLILPFTS